MRHFGAESHVKLPNGFENEELKLTLRHYGYLYGSVGRNRAEKYERFPLPLIMYSFCYLRILKFCLFFSPLFFLFISRLCSFQELEALCAAVVNSTPQLKVIEVSTF